MKTCGDIDGKACEYFDPKGWDVGDRECVSRHPRCPRKYEGTTFSTTACAPMVALVESRARVAEMERIEKAAKAWRMRFRNAQVRGRSSALARAEALRQFESILYGLGPDGKPVDP